MTSLLNQAQIRLLRTFHSTLSRNFSSSTRTTIMTVHAMESRGFLRTKDGVNYDLTDKAVAFLNRLRRDSTLKQAQAAA